MTREQVAWTMLAMSIGGFIALEVFLFAELVNAVRDNQHAWIELARRVDRLDCSQ